MFLHTQHGISIESIDDKSFAAQWRRQSKRRCRCFRISSRCCCGRRCVGLAGKRRSCSSVAICSCRSVVSFVVVSVLGRRTVVVRTESSCSYVRPYACSTVAYLCGANRNSMRCADFSTWMANPQAMAVDPHVANTPCTKLRKKGLTMVSCLLALFAAVRQGVCNTLAEQERQRTV